MRVSAETVRCQSDLGMFERLLEDLTVKRVNEQIEQAAKKDGGRTGLRRRLLTTSVRLSEAMAPDLRRIADECSERLELGIELELYVYSSPVYNAMCFKPEANRLFVMFSSRAHALA